MPARDLEKLAAYDHKDAREIAYQEARFIRQCAKAVQFDFAR